MQNDISKKVSDEDRHRGGEIKPGAPISMAFQMVLLGLQVGKGLFPQLVTIQDF